MRLTVTMAIMILKKNLKLSAAIECTVPSAELGNVKIKVSARQINETIYLKIEDIVFPELSRDEVGALTETVNTLSANWIKTSEPESAYDLFQKTGLYIGLENITAVNADEKKIADITKRNGVFTITSTKKAGSGSERYYEYRYTISRGALERAIKEYRPDIDMSLLERALEDTFSESDTEEGVKAVRIKDNKLLWSEYRTPNICLDLASLVGGDAATLPKKITIHEDVVNGSSADRTSAPNNTISEQEFDLLFAE